ncbi:MAG TPA: glycosyltransferase family 39 protein, partial [Candidatus Limnocylindrales bacterium]|nr:glycosyltransferase family 39 protein [Candidatus Limnocylindrales bacterium]
MSSWLGAAVAGAVAALAIARWIWALLSGGPILYGEGAVAHAAQLARDHLEYATLDDPRGPIFVAANYPPLYFHLAGLGEPFVAGRIASLAATAFVAVAIFRVARARAGSPIAATLAASWLACVPVAVWAPAVKPDLVAIAFTVGAVLAAHERGRAGLAGVLIALAVWSKPTAALPALALAIHLAHRDPRKIAPYVVGVVAASAGVLVLAWNDPRLMFEHVVTWNTLPWHADRAALLAILFVIVFGIPAVLYALARPTCAPGAYFIAAIGIVLLGGREGASLNFVLDLVAATLVGLAAIADRLPRPRFLALGIAVQLVIALVVVDPFGLGPGRAINTGAWEPAGRSSVVHGIAGDLLVEDAGLLIADGRTPRVDDLFL